ncbi:uncharacterized protein [Argopecten irradians]|uniref:uncharacterized protein n=1 Tax=Argopecten irradians TaxID=31199 RepID=UPI00370F8F01
MEGGPRNCQESQIWISTRAQWNPVQGLQELSEDFEAFMEVTQTRRLTTYMTENQYIDASVQKLGIPGFSGCVEHTSIITQLIREAKINKKDLIVIWLDLAYAYGTIPHTLIQEALEEHYHITEHFRRLIKSYFSGIHLRFTTKTFTTSWQELQKGIVTGCTISIILFVMGMNMIIRAGERETRGPKTSSNIRQPPNGGFMDDLTITTDTHVQARWILTALEETATLARMTFKPRKSRSLIIKKGRVTRQFQLKIQGEEIPTIIGNPIKCLGKWFDESLGDKGNIRRIEQQVQEGMRCIDKTGLPGKFKAWMYQRGLLPRLVWPLMLYEVSNSTVERMERIINRHLRRWLGVPRSFSAVGLYSRTAKLQLPLSSLVEEFKTGKAKLTMTLKESKDDKVRLAGVEVRTGRKWSAFKAVDEAECRLRHKDIVGTTAVGRQGLGTSKHTLWKKAGVTERRSLVQKEIRSSEEERRQTKAVELGVQGAWTRWNLVETPDCPLCGQRGTLQHILTTCHVVLSQGRYTWRHNQVLRKLADVLEKERKSVRSSQPRSKHTQIRFVREGETMTSRSEKSTGIIRQTGDWRLEVNLTQRLIFPDIVPTNLRPHTVLWSPGTKKVIIIELTVPWEERCSEAHERKRAKYEAQLTECREQGWHNGTTLLRLDAEDSPHSLWRMLSALGLSSRTRRTVVQRMAKAAERSSCWVWMKKDTSSWTPTTDAQ